MNFPVGLVLVLALTTSLANGEKTYTLLEMADAQPYNKIPCPSKCIDSLSTGLDMISTILGSVLPTIRFPVEFCKSCFIEGLGGFAVTHECFMSPQKNVFDHYVNMTFQNIGVKCKCNLDNSPSAMATKINAGKAIEGQCGYESYKNTHSCAPIQCEGNQGGADQSTVELATGRLPGSVVSVTLRVDTRPNKVTNETGAFPLRFAITTVDEIKLTHENPPEFNEAWNCLSQNMDGFICQLAANAPTPFYDCLSPKDAVDIVHNLLYLYGKCVIN